MIYIVHGVTCSFIFFIKLFKRKPKHQSNSHDYVKSIYLCNQTTVFDNSFPVTEHIKYKKKRIQST